MKKKIFSVLTAAVLVTSMVAGCSNKKVAETTAEVTTAAQTETTPAETKPEVKAQEADVVIIGATTAGLTAAVQAVEEGVSADKILLLDAGSEIDKSIVSNFAAFNAASSTYQANAGLEDDSDTYQADIKKAGGEITDEDLSLYLAENASGALDWLAEQGVVLSTITQDNGSSIPRSHRTDDGTNAGAKVIDTLTAKVGELKIPMTFDTTVKEIVLGDDGEVTAVKAEGKDGEILITCKAVIIADGGFGANAEMVKESSDAMSKITSISSKTSVGTGLALAKQAGGVLVNMDQMEMYPLVDTAKNTMVTEDLYRSGAILVNKEGKRFVSETETENRIATAVTLQPDATAYIIFDDTVKSGLKMVDDYVKAGIVKEADSVSALAKVIGVDEASLTSEAKEASGVSEGKIYAIECKPALYYTLGGIKTNTSTEVLTEDEGTVPGLFAAGEAIGGIHGSNAMDGDILSSNVVFGRTAGVEASGYVLD